MIQKSRWLRADQIFGIIRSVGDQQITLECHQTGQFLEYPVINGAIEAGLRGAYQFHQKAIPVLNPDFIATYKVTLQET